MEIKGSKVAKLSGVALFMMLACMAGSLFYLLSFYRNENGKQPCRSNLAQIGLAIWNYQSSWKQFPTSGSGWSWMTASLTFLEGNAPSAPDPSKPWNDAINRHLERDAKQPGEKGKNVVENDELHVFLCPLASPRSNQDGYGVSSYVGVGGLGLDAPTFPPTNPRAGCFGEREGTRIDQIKDGTSTTMAVIETARENGPWRAPGPATIRGLDRDHLPYIGKGRQFGGLHREGAMVLFADGSVRLVGEEIDPTVFEAMATIAGGERVAPDPHLVKP